MKICDSTFQEKKSPKISYKKLNSITGSIRNPNGEDQSFLDLIMYLVKDCEKSIFSINHYFKNFGIVDLVDHISADITSIKISLYCYDNNIELWEEKRDDKMKDILEGEEETSISENRIFNIINTKIKQLKEERKELINIFKNELYKDKQDSLSFIDEGSLASSIII